MFANPFSPVFGGKPDVFFGRKDILARFDSAMLDKGSEDRALFITGTAAAARPPCSSSSRSARTARIAKWLTSALRTPWAGCSNSSSRLTRSAAR